MLSWFEKRFPPFPPEEPTQAPNTLIAFCLHYAKGAWPFLIASTLITAAIAILEVWLFGFIGHIVDWLSLQNRQTFLADQAWVLVGMGAVVLVVLPVLNFLNSLLINQTLLGNFPMRIRWLAHRYLLDQSMGFYQDEMAGRIATKVMQTSLAVRECIIKLFEVLNYVGIYFLSTLFLIGGSNLTLALPLVAWFVLYLILLRYFVPRMGNVSQAQADARSLMTGRIVDSYSNIQTVKLFSHTQREASYARDGMSSFLLTVYRQMRLATGLNVSLHTINALLLFSTAALSIHLWLNEAVSVGGVAIALGLVMRLWNMSHWVMWEVGNLFENIGTAQDGMKTLSLPRKINDNDSAQPLVVSAGKIEFDNVSFHYGKGSGVMEKLSLTIQPGEKIGLIGASGAGKSTLVNLLLRFFDVESGEIRIDEQNIAHVTQESLRSQIGMVTQDTALLHRSVRDNLMYGRPDATDEMAWKAAEEAHVSEFVMQLRDVHGNEGLDAQVGERGVKLSGGQRQRLAIARVMLKDAPILIMDEATSALDSEVEAAIQENFERLMEGKTVIAIAHRLSTIAAMDRLIVMDKGVIVEQGTHQELLAHNGAYARLWHRQSGGFLES